MLAVLVFLAAVVAAGPVETPAPPTYADAGTHAVRALQTNWYVAGRGWRTCLLPACRTTDSDWGVDSLTYALYERWQAAQDATLVPVLRDLGSHIPDYRSLCTTPGKYCSYSDQPLWDAIAAVQTYFATNDAGALQKAKDGFNYVDASPAFKTGACPSIDYQRGFGGLNALKTLETDSNYIKAALLLSQATSDPAYLEKATAKYTAVRTFFLDAQVPLYSVYVFDKGGACVQTPHRFYSSVNGNMIWNGLNLYRATGNSRYIEDAVATANAVIRLLADPNGIHADFQAENDIAQPLVAAMHDLAKGGRYTPAATWLLRNAAAANAEMLPDGSFGRFWDGPVTPGPVTAFQTNGAFALMIAAADIAGTAAMPLPSRWRGDTFVPALLNASPGTNTITFTGSRIAFVGAIGDRCCEPGHASVFVDGVETVDATGIWQNKSSTGLRLPNSILFAWRWRTPGTHTVTFGPAAYNLKEGGTYLNITGYFVE